MKKVTLTLVLIGFLTSHFSQAYMTHDQIVRRLTSQEGEKTTKKGKVLFLPSKEVVSHKKKPKSKKHEQKSALKRFFRPSANPSPDIPTTSPSPTPMVVPVGALGVDLRARDTSVKSQPNPHCTAYALAAAMENKVGDHVSLSQPHVWSFYQQYSVEAAFNTVPGNKITTMEKWPDPRRTPYVGYLDEAKHKITKMVAIDHDTVEADIDEVKKELDHGNPIYMGVSVFSDMGSCFPTIRSTSSVTKGGHAVLVVGYHLDSAIKSGGYLIIKNSWGTTCGDNGYQYLDFSLCSKYGGYCYFYSVQQVD